MPTSAKPPSRCWGFCLEFVPFPIWSERETKGRETRCWACPVLRPTHAIRGPLSARCSSSRPVPLAGPHGSFRRDAAMVACEQLHIEICSHRGLGSVRGSFNRRCCWIGDFQRSPMCDTYASSRPFGVLFLLGRVELYFPPCCGVV